MIVKSPRRKISGVVVRIVVRARNTRNTRNSSWKVSGKLDLPVPVARGVQRQHEELKGKGARSVTSVW